MIKVFYDGKCGVCLKEINYYKKIAPKHIFHWVDVNENQSLLDERQLSLVDVLKILHVEDNNHVMHLGIDGFIVIWQQLKGWRVLASFVKLPVVRPLLMFAYRHFANWRFKRLNHCQTASKDTRE